MVSKIIKIVLLILILTSILSGSRYGFISCSNSDKKLPHYVNLRPDNFPEALEPIEGAYEIEYRMEGVTKIAPGYSMLAYLVKDNYPGEKARHNVAAVLKSHNYSLLKYELHDPQTIAEYSWIEEGDHMDPKIIRLLENWSDGNHLLQVYYSYPLPISECSNELSIVVFLVGESSWLSLFNDYQKIHPE